jgi:lysozyme family protein
MYSFEQMLRFIVIQYEGGWSDHPQDPGGATMKGVTISTYRRAVRAGVIEMDHIPTREDLFNIPDEHVEAIYREMYWDACQCYNLPSGLDLLVFDAAVNQGPKRSVEFLQKALKTEGYRPGPIDGIIGPMTLGAVRRALNKTEEECFDNLSRLAMWFTLFRMLHYSYLKRIFRKGWFRRGLETFRQSIITIEEGAQNWIRTQQ